MCSALLWLYYHKVQNVRGKICWEFQGDAYSAVAQPFSSTWDNFLQSSVQFRLINKAFPLVLSLIGHFLCSVKVAGCQQYLKYSTQPIFQDLKYSTRPVFRYLKYFTQPVLGVTTVHHNQCHIGIFQLSPDVDLAGSISVFGCRRIQIRPDQRRGITRTALCVFIFTSALHCRGGRQSETASKWAPGRQARISTFTLLWNLSAVFCVFNSLRGYGQECWKEASSVCLSCCLLPFCLFIQLNFSLSQTVHLHVPDQAWGADHGDALSRQSNHRVNHMADY